MKKAFLMIIASLLLGGMASAQQHYSFNLYDYPDNMPVTTLIQIDGVQQTSTTIELGAFVGDEVRGSVHIGTGTVVNQAWLQIYYEESGENVSFKIYDHATETEYTNCSTTLTTRMTGWGTASEPVILNFLTTETFTKAISGYGTGDNKWYLIASPIGEVSPTSVDGMIQEIDDENNYDLYTFNQSADPLEWINYKDETDGGFNMFPGQGYLYASKQDTILTFSGTALEFPGDEGVYIPLSYQEGTRFAGYNLIGNPFAEQIGIYSEFYIMNASGTELEVADRNYLEPMEGAFVVATGANEYVLLGGSGGSGWGPGALELRVSGDHGCGDYAIIRFGQGKGLPKLMLNPQHTNLCFPMDDVEYAVAYVSNMGEMPVSFKAGEDGTYTLSLTSENVTFSYLHLIDNMNGNDIDLLQTPSYTFEANVSDSESRFRLVFAQQ